MSEHEATIEWKGGPAEFTPPTYDRDHTWTFDGGAVVNASAAPAYRGNPALVDPEEAYVAALSSCHMLTFLALAAKKRFVVTGYRDRAVGTLGKNDAGRMAVTRVELRPEITFAPDATPDAAELAALHESAHGHCFIANSVSADVSVAEPTPQAS